jgi:DNA-binding CsgD family transcriptional regulator
LENRHYPNECCRIDLPSILRLAVARGYRPGSIAALANERQLGDVIGQLYEAAADPSCLTDLSTLLAPYFGTASGMVHTSTHLSLEMPAVLSATENFDDSARAAYVEHYHSRNVWFQRGIKKGPQSIVIGQELLPDSELLRSEWYDYCLKLDAFHLLGINVWIAEDLVGGVGFHRPRSAKPFGETERRKALLILPHLRRALQIQHRIAGLTRERGLALNLIDGLGIGIILVAGDARLLFVNRTAERVLQGGLGLSVLKGRLRSQDQTQRQNVERLIAEAALTSAGKGIKAGGVLTISRPNGRPLSLLISPLRAASIGYGPELPAAVVIFSDPESDATSPEEALRTIFGLTRAQARLVSALLAGQSLLQYALSAGISINTAKTQMRQVFAKTGYDRQVDLVRALTADPVIRLALR